MESNSRPDRQAATDSLRSLSSDSERLSRTTRVPTAALWALGVTAAWWVASATNTQPGSDYRPSPTGFLAWVAAIGLVLTIQQRTGIKLRRLGRTGWWALVGMLVGCLGLYSIALGLVASELRWWALIPAAVAIPLTSWLASIAYRSAVSELRNA